MVVMTAGWEESTGTNRDVIQGKSLWAAPRIEILPSWEEERRGRVKADGVPSLKQESSKFWVVAPCSVLY